jgi:hypothetical protein
MKTQQFTTFLNIEFLSDNHYFMYMYYKYIVIQEINRKIIGA